MHDTIAPNPSTPTPRPPPGAGSGANGLRGGYRGPDRRNPRLSGWQWLAAALEEIDYGVLLLDEHGEAVVANQAALAELGAEHPLVMADGSLHARHPRDAVALQAALQAAQRGLRRLLTVGDAPQRCNLSVVPIGPTIASTGRSQQPYATLVMLAKRDGGGGRLALAAFARGHGLSAGETRVLEGLVEGLRPAAIAQRHGVALSTVRSQVGSIRNKTGTPSISALVRQVSALPPLRCIVS